MAVKEVDIKDIKIREDLYPREKIDEGTIQSYMESLDQLPPIVLNQDKEVINGVHRLKAHERAGRSKIKCEIDETKSDGDFYKKAVESNAKQGKRLSYKEKKRASTRLFKFDYKNTKEIAKMLSVSESCIYKWTVNIRDELEEETKREIIMEYLHAELNQEQVAKKSGIEQGTVSKYIKDYIKEIFEIVNLQNGIKSDVPAKYKEKYSVIFNFKPYFTDIWDIYEPSSFDESDIETDLETFNKNLLFHYTKPFDKVYAPHNNSLIGTCKDFFRRYYGSNDFLDKPPDLALLDDTQEFESTVKQLKRKTKYVAINIQSLEQDNTTFSMMQKLGYKLVDRIIMPIPNIPSAEDGTIQHSYESLLVFSVK